MIRESQTAVIARNEIWQGTAATEPYEAGWATEAIVFVRALAFRIGSDDWSAGARLPPGKPSGQPAIRVQLSADGMRWIDEGTGFELPRSTDHDSFLRVRHFGNWLRIVADLPDGLAMKALVTIHLK